jgi:class 3 adenylate cyclase
MAGSKIKLSLKRLLFSIPLRFKITIPYLVVASLLAGLATYQVGRSFVGRSEERFFSQLNDATQRAAEGVIDLEETHLQAIRTIAFTAGVPQAVVDGDDFALRELVYPQIINNQIDFVEILNAEGTPVATWHRIEEGNEYLENEITAYDKWPIVEQVLKGDVDELGDKFVDIVDTPWGQAIYTVGPILTEDQLLGIVLIGTPLPKVVPELAAMSIADATLYDPSGLPVASTLNVALLGPIEANLTEELGGVSEGLPTRRVSLGSREYIETVDHLKLRDLSTQWYLGVSLNESLIQETDQGTMLKLLAIFGVGVLALIALGVGVAQIIAIPIIRLVQASREVGSGNLDVNVQVHAEDEIGLLTRGFNNMVTDLKQREYIRAMFGRMVSQDVSEAVLKGEIALDGEIRDVSVLFTDVRGFTTIAEAIEPGDVLSLLNQYFTIILEATRKHSGVINNFGGDSVLAVFGAPIHRPVETTLEQTILTALEIQRGAIELNARRVENGMPPLRYGVGINSGDVIAGTVGTQDRFEYTVIGDVVNVAARLQGMSRQFPHTPILIPASSVEPVRHKLAVDFQYLGDFMLRGKAEPVPTYAILGSNEEIPPGFNIFDRFPYPTQLALMACSLHCQGFTIPTIAETLQVGSQVVSDWLAEASMHTDVLRGILMAGYGVTREEISKLKPEMVY